MYQNEFQYRSPSTLAVVSRLEEKWLAKDTSWWTGRGPIYVRTVADVPEALYLNYAAPESYAAALAPGVFTPIGLPDGNGTTLFTILIFRLERARPHWVPRRLAALSPRIMQSNWRFYGRFTEKRREPSAACVFFVRTVTTSLALAVFGRRLARCFPLRRAAAMRLSWSGDEIAASIEPGTGSAPALAYQGRRALEPPVNDAFRQQFSAYTEYARWIVDQHLSLTLWPGECVVQDMHLNFRAAQIIPLTCTSTSITAPELMTDEMRLIDSFAIRDLQVFLDDVYVYKSS